MKIRKAIWIAAAVCGLCAMEVRAADAVENQMNVSARVEPHYTVTIPVDKEIPYGALETDIGSLTLTDALLELGYVVRVDALHREELFSGSNKLAYQLFSGSEVFSSVIFEAEGDTAPLSVKIAQEDWNHAAAGNYADTITFRVNYEKE